MITADAIKGTVPFGGTRTPRATRPRGPPRTVGPTGERGLATRSWPTWTATVTATWRPSRASATRSHGSAIRRSTRRRASGPASTIFSTDSPFRIGRRGRRPGRRPGRLVDHVALRQQRHVESERRRRCGTRTAFTIATGHETFLVTGAGVNEGRRPGRAHRGRLVEARPRGPGTFSARPSGRSRPSRRRRDCPSWT